MNYYIIKFKYGDIKSHMKITHETALQLIHKFAQTPRNIKILRKTNTQSSINIQKQTTFHFIAFEGIKIGG